MRKMSKAVAIASVVLAVATACDNASPATKPTPQPSATTTEPPNVTEHESGPESPITYGLTVPKGATQIAPLQRTRSPQLIAAYQPALQAILDQEAAELAAKEAEDRANGVTPTPTRTPPSNRPNDDSFKKLETPPGPDTTVSYMRIDGDPSDVVRRMVAQLAALLPTAEAEPNDLSTFCAEQDQRIVSCKLALRGLTADELDVSVVLTVDPGNIKTRVSPAASQTKPVMTLTVQYVGEPRFGQLKGEPDQVDKVAKIEDTPELSGLIWPKMDLDAPSDEPLIGDWMATTSAIVLVSGRQPRFAVVTTDTASDADFVAQDFITQVMPTANVTQDVVEDLNEVATTYRATNSDGTVAQATFVLSARGTYVLVSYLPKN